MIDFARTVSGQDYVCGALLRGAIAGAAVSALVFGVSELALALESADIPPQSELAGAVELVAGINAWLAPSAVALFMTLVALIVAPLTAQRAATLGMSPWIGVASALIILLAPGAGGQLHAEMADWQSALSPSIWLFIVLAALRVDRFEDSLARFGLAYRGWVALLWMNAALVGAYCLLALLVTADLAEPGLLARFLAHASVGKFGTLFALLSMCLLMIDRSKSLRENSHGAKKRVVALKAHAAHPALSHLSRIEDKL